MQQQNVWEGLMNEKDLKILEKYDIEFDKIGRGRGSYLCESKGLTYLLKEYHVSEEKASVVAGVMDYLYQNDKSFPDIFVRNSEGNYISRDRDNVGFLLKQWTKGQECDVSDIEDIESALKKLGCLHNLLEKKDKTDFNSEPVSCLDEINKRIRELKKIRNYIVKKNNKTEFELLYINRFGSFIETAENVAEEAKKLEKAEFKICHGDFNHHNVLFSDNQAYIVNFDKCHYGSQIEDLYLFMRKILEKYDWDISLFLKMKAAYESERKLSDNDKFELYLRFSFPEKFWKISNHYFNTRKVWGIEKNRNKMDKLLEQTKVKQEFLDSYLKPLC